MIVKWQKGESKEGITAKLHEWINEMNGVLPKEGGVGELAKSAREHIVIPKERGRGQIMDSWMLWAELLYHDESVVVIGSIFKFQIAPKQPLYSISAII